MATYQLKEGTLLGRRYRIKGVLGSGTFGDVYRATHEVSFSGTAGLEFRDVALKVFKNTYVSLDNAGKIFREAIVMERLFSQARSRGLQPHVVEVYDIGVFEELWQPYLAMELLEGGTLDSLLAKKVPALADAVGLLRQICSAMSLAHEQGLYHRDLKPANVLFTKGNFLKVADFGLAIDRLRAYQELGQAGTISYSPPDRGPATGAFDVYSLGVMLVEFLLKRNPLSKVLAGKRMPLEKAQELLAELRDPLGSRIDEELLELRQDVTMQRILSHCLAMSPSQRFRDAAELDKALESWQQKRPLTAAVLPPPVVRSCEDLLKDIGLHRAANNLDKWEADLKEAERRCRDSKVSYAWAHWYEAQGKWADAANRINEGMSRDGRRSPDVLKRLAGIRDKEGKKWDAQDLRDEAAKAALKR